MQFGAKIIFKKKGKKKHKKNLIIFPISLSTLGQYYELHQHEIKSPCENVLYLNCGKTAYPANLSIRIHHLFLPLRSNSFIIISTVTALPVGNPWDAKCVGSSLRIFTPWGKKSQARKYVET